VRESKCERVGAREQGERVEKETTLEIEKNRDKERRARE